MSIVPSWKFDGPDHASLSARLVLIVSDSNDAERLRAARSSGYTVAAQRVNTP
jgi:hypothetical protein